MNKRLEMLKQLTASGQADSFAWYALAMELRKTGEPEAAVATFAKLRDQDPEYLPMYLMAAQTLIEVELESDAKPWLNQGIELAKRKGDTKALSELSDALAQLPS